MVDRATRVMRKRFRRTPGGTTATHYSRAKKTYAECAVTGNKLLGMGNQMKSSVRKNSKSAKKPSVKFGGVLSSPARKELWENYALVAAGRKDYNEVPSKLKKFLKQDMVKVKE